MARNISNAKLRGTPSQECEGKSRAGAAFLDLPLSATTTKPSIRLALSCRPGSFLVSRGLRHRE